MQFRLFLLVGQLMGAIGTGPAFYSDFFRFGEVADLVLEQGDVTGGSFGDNEQLKQPWMYSSKADVYASRNVPCPLPPGEECGPKGAPWNKLTYGSQPLYSRIRAEKGTNANQCTTNKGDKTMGECFGCHDESGSCSREDAVFTNVTEINGTKTVVVTQHESGRDLKLTRTYTLLLDRPLLSMLYRLENTGSNPVKNIEIFVGADDNYVESTDQPYMQVGTCHGGYCVNASGPPGQSAFDPSGNDTILAKSSNIAFYLGAVCALSLKPGGVHLAAPCDRIERVLCLPRSADWS